MANLDSLDKTIKELETHSREMKTIKETLNELNELYSKIEKTSEVQEDLNAKSQKIKDFFSEAMDEMLHRFDEVNNKQREFNEQLERQITHLSQENKQELQGVQYKFNEFHNLQQELNTEVLQNVKALSNENTKLYLDQKKHFENQLELSISEVQNQNNQTKNDLINGINSLDKKVSESENRINGALIANKKKSNINLVLLIVLLTTSIANIVLVLM